MIAYTTEIDFGIVWKQVKQMRAIMTLLLKNQTLPRSSSLRRLSLGRMLLSVNYNNTSVVKQNLKT